MKNIQTATDQHGIKKMAFAMELSKAIEPQQLKEYSEQFHRFKSEQNLPRRRLRQGVNFSFEVSGGASRSSVSKEGELNGVTFDRLGADGETDLAFAIESRQIIAYLGKYERWTSALKLATDMFDLANSIVEFYPHVSLCGLEYVDEFYWIGDGPVDSSEVLQRGSPYVVPNCVGLLQAWHSHHGFFRDDELININTELLPDEERKTIRITSNHRVSLSGANVAPSRDVVAGYFGRMHESNKKIMREMLTPEVQELIGLSV